MGQRFIIPLKATRPSSRFLGDLNVPNILIFETSRSVLDFGGTAWKRHVYMYAGEVLSVVNHE